MVILWVSAVGSTHSHHKEVTVADTIRVQVRSVYGRQVIDIIDPDQQRHLQALTGLKGLTVEKVGALRSLGLEVEEVPQAPTI